MLVVESNHRPGVVGVVGGELARYHAFSSCITALNIPLNTKGFFALGYDVGYNRGSVIDFALKCPDADWVQIYDDDHVFAPDTLLRLLDHMYRADADVIVPLYAQRTPPYRPCIYKTEMPDGAFAIFNWVDLEGQTGLMPIVSAGAGGILIRRRVLEKLVAPYFERQGKIGEDHLFLKKAREAGFSVYCALDVTLGHLTTCEIWPHRNERNEWCGKVDLKGEQSFAVEYWDSKYREPAASA